MYRIILFIVLIVIAIGLTIYFVANKKPASVENSNPDNSPEQSQFVLPIDRWQERIFKKPFGIYITPQNSPIQPEKFKGYHTGVDFEVFPDELDKDIEIMAICKGQLLEKRYISGYGGVAIQACKLGNDDITVLYGHLKLSSIEADLGQQLSAGEKIGILGKAYSSETDGERKHLHLSIHKGKTINVAGYVQTPAELNNWINFEEIIK